MGGLSTTSRVVRESWKPPWHIQGGHEKLETPQGISVSVLEQPLGFPRAAHPRCSTVGTPLWGGGVTFGVCLCPPPLLAAQAVSPFPQEDSSGSQKLLVPVSNIRIRGVCADAVPGGLSCPVLCVWSSPRKAGVAFCRGWNCLPSLPPGAEPGQVAPVQCQSPGEQGVNPCSSCRGLPSLSVSPAACPGDSTIPVLPR